MALNIGLSVLLAAWFTRLGWMPHGGLALANSLATGLEAIVLWLLMRRRLAGLEGGRVFQGAWQALLGTAVMGVALLVWLDQAAGLPLWILVIGGVLVGGAVYGALLLLLRVAEAQILLRIMRPGATRDWRALLKEATGEDLSAQPMLEYFAPLMEWLEQENAGRAVGW